MQIYNHKYIIVLTRIYLYVHTSSYAFYEILYVIIWVEVWKVVFTGKFQTRIKWRYENKEYALLNWHETTLAEVLQKLWIMKVCETEFPDRGSIEHFEISEQTGCVLGMMAWYLYGRGKSSSMAAYQ